MRQLAIIFTVILLGCTNVENRDSETSDNGNSGEISAANAVTVAEEYLKNRSIDFSNYKANAQWHADAWWVMFDDVVPKPGGHFVVLVSHDGKVIELLPGE